MTQGLNKDPWLESTGLLPTKTLVSPEKAQRCPEGWPALLLRLMPVTPTWSIEWKSPEYNSRPFNDYSARVSTNTDLSVTETLGKRNLSWSQFLSFTVKPFSRVILKSTKDPVRKMTVWQPLAALLYRDFLPRPAGLPENKSQKIAELTPIIPAPGGVWNGKTAVSLSLVWPI
jgi:hypothetical protein